MENEPNIEEILATQDLYHVLGIKAHCSIESGEEFRLIAKSAFRKARIVVFVQRYAFVDLF
jgi:hypothetical protein